MAMEFQKQYPESKEQNENSQQESTNIIGFHMDSNGEDLDYYDDFNEE